MSDATPRYPLFATASKGTEPALRDELREKRFKKVRADRGGVHFEGTLRDAMRAALELRCALRVLVEVSRFRASSGDELYEGVRAVDWSELLSPKHTLAVRASCRSSALTHSQFIAQRTKDAIVDPLRERWGSRPSVDRDDPDLLVAVHLLRDEATLYLDVGGASLHARGWRADALEAPLKETLAASLLRLGGWDRQSPLLDPMCGSGTLAIEAWLWSREVVPGLGRGPLGAERWASFDETERRALRELREDIGSRTRTQGPPIFASDVDPRAVALASTNAGRAGARIDVQARDVRHLEPLQPGGFVILNPPYGERLQTSDALERELGQALRKLRGHRVAVLAGSPALARAIPMRPAQSLPVFNGDLECRLLVYDVS